MSNVKIWVHAVWSTYKRRPVMNEEVKLLICNHIKENSIVKKIEIDCVNGYLDHLHLLFKLPPTKDLSKVINLLKGEVGYWLNKSELLPEPFYWQKGYYAGSVYPKHLSNVRNYIHRQVEHHQSQPYYQELLKFCDDNSLDLLKEDLID